jgi:hypothetical protein
MQEEPKLTLDEVLQLRPKTDEVARFLRTMLTQHLETLRPLLDPGRLLGKSAGAGRTAWMEKSLGEYRGLYEKHARPFRFSSDFDPEGGGESEGWVEVQPSDYIHEARTESGSRRIRITAPTRWVLTYAGELSLERMKTLVSAREESQSPLQQRFVHLALLLYLVFQRSPGVVRLLEGLRFRLDAVPCEQLYGLPLMTVSFALPTFRPDDSLILKATNLSGVPAFIELVDLEALRQIEDPLKCELEKLVV